MSPHASDLELAYLAGIIDADGYVTATSSQRRGRWYFGAQLGITGSRREPHDLAAALFGGSVSEHQPTRDRAHHRVQYHWQRGGRTAVEPLEALLPYLRIKRQQAELALALQEDLMYADPTDRYPWAPAGWDPTPSHRLTVASIRALHTRRGQPAESVGSRR